MHHKVTVTGFYYTDLLHILHVAIKEVLRKVDLVDLFFCMTVHPLTRSHAGQAALVESRLKKSIFC